MEADDAAFAGAPEVDAAEARFQAALDSMTAERDALADSGPPAQAGAFRFDEWFAQATAPAGAAVVAAAALPAEDPAPAEDLAPAEAEPAAYSVVAESHDDEVTVEPPLADADLTPQAGAVATPEADTEPTPEPVLEPIAEPIAQERPSVVASAAQARRRWVSEYDEVVDGGYGWGSAAPVWDGAMPLGHPVKANRQWMKFQEPADGWYDQMQADVWFVDADTARRFGFTKD